MRQNKKDKTKFVLLKGMILNMENKVIGIEGLVGCGKTSICRELLNRIPNSILLNGGNMYRAIAYAIISSGKSIQDLKNIDVRMLMTLLKIELKIEERETVFYSNGIKLEEKNLQSISTSLAVSNLGKNADNTKMFEFARNLINTLKQKNNIIISGRGIIKIYPEVDYHLFLTATLEERVNRKCIQYNNQQEKEEIEKNIVQRDKLQEEAGFYEISPKTIVIDVTECNSILAATDKVLKSIRE